MDTLRGKTAWVTGAGSGIGESAALKLAEAGATVVLTGRREAPLAGVAGRIRAAGGKLDDTPMAVERAGAMFRRGWYHFTSLIAIIDTPRIMLLQILAACPAPAPPQWTIRLPILLRIGSPAAKASAVPPTMKVSVPAAAPPVPPDTGAS